MNDLPIKKAQEGPVFRITLDCPANRNALSQAMLQSISSALDEAEPNDARAIVIGATGNVFCPGHDLKEMAAARSREDGGKAFYVDTMRACSEVMQKIVHHPLPVIAQVEGIATAAGCQLVASCDLAVAGKSARFATPGVHIGLFCSTPMVALSRNVNRKHAMEMLLTGEDADAEQALRIGLINRVAEDGEVGKEVARLTDAIVSKSSATVKIGKQAFYRQLEMPLDEAYVYCSQVMVENMLMRDAEEGINAFIEKRSPTWTDS